MYFNLENVVLRNLGQAYTFFSLLGFSSITSFKKGVLSNECLIGQMPNYKHVRYANFDDNNYEEIIEVIKDRYDSTTNYENAIAFLKIHFHLDVPESAIYDIYCGEYGVAVIFKDTNWFLLEMSNSSIYKFENL